MLVGRSVAAATRQATRASASCFLPYATRTYSTTPESEKVAKFKGQKGSDVCRASAERRSPRTAAEHRERRMLTRPRSE